MEGSSREFDYMIDGNLIIDEAVRSCRLKKKQLDVTYCPICSITLRSTDIELHLVSEIDKLCKVSNTRHKTNSKTNSPSTSAVNGVSEHGKEWDTFEKVRSNRHRRLRIKTRKRPLEEVTCPVCNKEIAEELNAHVEGCLRNSCHLNSDSEDNIDVEGFEEYEWAGQSRVRATSMLPGGVASLGTGISITDEDEDLVVDGDDTNAYGLPQYSEQDIVIYDSDREREALRKAVIGFDKDNSLENNPSESKTEGNDYNKGDPILEALKNRIRELESQYMEDAYKCLICMERYKTPVISTCCWHVHCEQCWLQTLGAKKLCPQCNMITSPMNLRRIYM